MPFDKMFLFVICLTMTDRRKFPIHLCHTHTHSPFTEQFISFRLIQKQMLRFFFTFNNRTQGLPNLLSLTTKQKKTNWTSNKWNLAREVNSLIFRCFCFIAAKLTTRKVFGLFFMPHPFVCYPKIEFSHFRFGWIKNETKSHWINANWNGLVARLWQSILIRFE